MSHEQEEFPLLSWDGKPPGEVDAKPLSCECGAPLEIIRIQDRVGRTWWMLLGSGHIQDPSAQAIYAMDLGSVFEEFWANGMEHKRQ